MTIKICFDCSELKKKDTPKKLELEEEDLIDVFYEK